MSFASLPVVPLAGGGSAPVPVCLDESVANVTVFLLNVEPPPRIVLQPWEGLTVRSLLEALAEHPRFLPVPAKAAKGAVAIGYSLSRVSSRMGALTRRLDLLVNGQRQDAGALRDLGFEPPVSVERYRALGKLVRRKTP